MPKISFCSELMLMSLAGLGLTIYEGTVQNMNENVKEIWSSNFSSMDVSAGMEPILKSVMTAVTLARGLTVHVYIAAYLLMAYPLIFGRGVTLLLLWMLLCALRSIIVNLVALSTGCVLCSLNNELRPVCFEFVTTKAIEIAFSVFMWLSVNDYHIRLRARRREILSSRKPTKSTQVSDSDTSASSSMSSDLSFMEFEDGDSSSEDSLIVKAAVEWLMRMAFGLRYENRRMEMDTARAEKFLNMTPEELTELQNRIKAKLQGKPQHVDRATSTDKLSCKPELSIFRSNATDSTNFDDTHATYGNQSNDLVIQSKASQTQEPSRKLRERLFSRKGPPKNEPSIQNRSDSVNSVFE